MGIFDWSGISTFGQGGLPLIGHEFAFDLLESVRKLYFHKDDGFGKMFCGQQSLRASP